jgi:hypothetical protein
MGDTIHFKKLFGGRASAQEIHAKYAWHRQKCSACGQPPAMRVQVFLLINDMEASLREAIKVQIALKAIRTTKTDHGIAVKWSDVYACKNCQPTCERQAARAPSYAIVDIDRGPSPDRPVVGVVSALS